MKNIHFPNKYFHFARVRGCDQIKVVNGSFKIRNYELSLNKDKDWLHTKQDCKAICGDIL